MFMFVDVYFVKFGSIVGSLFFSLYIDIVLFEKKYLRKQIQWNKLEMS